MDPVITLLIAIVAAAAPTILSVATLLKVIKTHDLVNSRMTELLVSVKRDATLEAQKVATATAQALLDKHNAERKITRNYEI